MNLQKLFEMQAKLDADITAHHPVQEGENRLEKKVLALLVELGECAQEWRGFKFWSNDQEPRLIECEECGGDKIKGLYDDEECFCDNAKHPLLEEYVDCLHFILSIGNDLNFEYEEFLDRNFTIDGGINRVFVGVSNSVSEILSNYKTDFGRYYLYDALRQFMKLGRLLGFTEEQIEQAYYDKNKVNFERQEQGY